MSLRLLLLSLLLFASAVPGSPSPGLPFVINTWSGPFTAATAAAYELLLREPAAVLAAVERGCAACEQERCDGTVGYGGSPDERCETTLDALVMDGDTLNVGAVAGLRRIRSAISVARRVLEHTTHSMLVGDLATQFAVENGFAEADLATDQSLQLCQAWKRAGCPSNYRLNVSPDPASSCGPYTPLPINGSSARARLAHQASHDTIALVAVSAAGAMAAGTSTNGAAHKVPGRVGDAPVPGSGAYVDSRVGGCGATGDGDLMMRFLPCYQAVESMRRGLTPREAAEDAIRRMLARHPNINAGLVVVDNNRRHAGAAAGWRFSYSYWGGGLGGVEVVEVEPLFLESHGDL